MTNKSTLTVILFITTVMTFGQSLSFDNCGKDSSAVLNRFEINYIDSVFFALPPCEMRKDEFHSFTNGFNFMEKRIAFFDCGKTTSNGYMTKKEFFQKILPEYRGPHGLTILKEDEKIATGYDAIIVINCKMIDKNELVRQLQ